MENFLDNYYQISLYYQENRYNVGFETLPNKKIIFWVCDEIYFINDELEKQLLIELDIYIKSIDILNDYIFFICSSKTKNSYLYFFNDDYTLNKKMNLSNTDFLLKLDINTFIFIEKSDKNKLVIMKIIKGNNKKLKQCIEIVKNDIDISLNYKICKINNNKFLFYSETKDHYSYIKSYYIYTIDFINNKFIIQESSFDSSTTDSKVYSFITINEKIIAQFSIDVYDNKNLVIHLINIETMEFMFKYNTKIFIEESEDYFEESIIKLFSKIERAKEPLFYINYTLNEIPFFQLMKIFDKESYDKYIYTINDLDKNKPKGFTKVFLRVSNNIENLYIIYFCSNNIICIENLDEKYCTNFLNILSKLEVKLVDDDYDENNGGCGGDILGPYYFVDNIGYNETDDIVVNEEKNFFILKLLHTDGWFHECLQIIGYYKKNKVD